MLGWQSAGSPVPWQSDLSAILLLPSAPCLPSRLDQLSGWHQLLIAGLRQPHPLPLPSSPCATWRSLQSKAAFRIAVVGFRRSVSSFAATRLSKLCLNDVASSANASSVRRGQSPAKSSTEASERYSATRRLGRSCRHACRAYTFIHSFIHECILDAGPEDRVEAGPIGRVEAGPIGRVQAGLIPVYVILGCRANQHSCRGKKGQATSQALCLPPAGGSTHLY